MQDRRERFTLGRRDLLRSAAVAGAAPLVAGLGACSSSEEAEGPRRFKHGIASGDPLPDAVILWTRVTGENDAPVDVEWEVFEDPELTKKAASGVFHTDAARDFTVKVDVKGLAAGRAYYYRFRALGGTSKIGRTRTAPSGPTSRVRLAMVSCASYAHGYFHGYRAVAGHLDLDAVVHLGDYIYEYGDGEYGDVRQYQPPTEILTLADYRMRHAHYKGDADLQEVHRQHAFITIWDDHETANDSYKDGAENHTEILEGPFADRKAAARKAYMEWMPIREQGPERIFRKLAFGDLVDLVLLDTRLYARTKQAGGIVGAPPAPDPARTLLGDEQAAWMEDQLKTSTARWKLLGQQVMVGNLILEKGKQLANLDQWQGYPESRTRLLTFFRDSGVKNIVVLTGDIHSSWANEIVVDPNDATKYDPATGKGSLAVEIVTPGITSPGVPDLFLSLIEKTRPINPHVRFIEPSHRGFVFLDITAERVQAAWYLFEDIVEPAPTTPVLSAGWTVKDGSTRLEADMSLPPPREGVPAAAP
jgi:alkaline phosphatase D